MPASPNIAGSRVGDHARAPSPPVHGRRAFLPPLAPVAALLTALALGSCGKKPPPQPPPPPPPPPELLFDQPAPIQNWLVCGPWPVADVEALAAHALSTDFLIEAGGEEQVDPLPGAACRWGGEELQFHPAQADADGLDIALQTDRFEGVVYLAARIRSPAPRRAFFHLECSAPVRVWCNGRELLRHEGKSDAPAFHAFTSTLVAGVNRLLVKVAAGPSPGALRLFVADDAAHRHAMASAAIRHIGMPILETDIRQGGPFGEQLRLGARFTIDTLGCFEGLGAAWRVSSPDGRIEWQGTAPLAERPEASLPAAEGFHRVRLEVSGLLAEPLSVEREILTSRDPLGLHTNSVARARAIAANPAKFPYAGRVLEALDRLQGGGTNDPSGLRLLLDRLGEVERADLGTRRGTIDWAVRSSVDGTGQSFRLLVPEDYRAEHRYPLHVRLTPVANESEDASLAELWREALVLWPGPRATSSGLRGAGASDVLDAVAIVERTWSIDERRIYLSGEGALGEAAWRLAARRPGRFDALRVVGARAPNTPFENLARTPVFSTHSEDDPEIPWWLSRVPLEALSRIGGFAVSHDLPDAGHDLARLRQALGTGIHWERAQRATTPPERVQLVATDGAARHAEWVEAVEWEDGSRPARLLVRAGRDNSLFLDADNAATVRLDLARAPLDTQRPVRITINGRRRGIADPPFTDALYFALSGEFLRASSTPPGFTGARPYRPVDPALAADSSALLIVPGTTGSPAMKAALRLAAEQLRRMPSPSPAARPAESALAAWPVRNDTDVTDEDLATRSLILLGGPAHNALTARIASRLPVREEDGRLVESDDTARSLERRAWYLHYFNPLAPQREIFLFSCSEPVFFAAGMPAPPAAHLRSPQPDFMLWSIDGGALATARFLRAGWQWNAPGSQRTPLPEGLCSQTAWAEVQAGAFLKAAAADFAVLPLADHEASPPLFIPGEATWNDALACTPDSPLWRFTLPAREIERLRDSLRAAAAGSKASPGFRLYPDKAPSEDSRGFRRIVAPSSSLATALLHTESLRVEHAGFCEESLLDALRWQFLSEPPLSPAPAPLLPPKKQEPAVVP